MKKNEKKAGIFAKVAEVHRKLERLLGTFEDYEAEGGVTLIIDGEPTAEKEAKVVDGDGNEVGAPDGDYTLTAEGYAGWIVRVSGGVITEVIPIAPAEMEDVETTVEMFSKLYDIIGRLADRVNTLTEELGAIKDAQAADGVMLVEMEEKLKKIDKMPAGYSSTRRKPEEPAKFSETLTAGQRVQIRRNEAIRAARALDAQINKK